MGGRRRAAAFFVEFTTLHYSVASGMMMVVSRKIGGQIRSFRVPVKSHSRRSPLSPFLRVLASAAAALVLTLSVFSASPELHSLLHGSVSAREFGFAKSVPAKSTGSDACSAEEDDGCAVALFAQGVSLPLLLPVLTRPELVQDPANCRSSAEFFWVQPRYLRQPERGPPVG